MQYLLKRFPLGAKILEGSALIVMIAFFVQRLLYRFYFWNDSTSYVTAAANFVKHGTLFVYINWPSWTMRPSTEIYADFPPGYPLFLSFFMFLFRDVMLSVAIAQSLAVAGMFYAVYRTTVLLEIPPLLRFTTLFLVGSFQPHRDSLQGMLTEPLYLALCFAVLNCALDMWKNGESTKKWIFTCVLVFCASGVRWNGFACIVPLALPIWKYRKNLFWKSAAILAAGALPISLWFLRNYLFLHRVSTFYEKPRFLWDRVNTPFNATVYWWGHGYALIAIAIFAFSFAPFFLRKIRTQEAFLPYAAVVLAWITQFLVIYALSLVTYGMTPVDGRYLMPTYFLFTVCLFYSAGALLRVLKIEKLSVVVVALCVLAFLPKAIHHLKEQKLDWIGAWTLPAEKALWAEIQTKPYFKQASHFYTDMHPIHQVFAGIPQRIVRDGSQESQPEQLKTLFDIPQNPFFVLADGSALLETFERKVAPKIARLKKEKGAGYTIYYRD